MKHPTKTDYFTVDTRKRQSGPPIPSSQKRWRNTGNPNPDCLQRVFSDVKQRVLYYEPRSKPDFTKVVVMTTAHRPTWKAAVGKANEGGWTAGGAVSTQVSALDAPAHTKLKLRKGPQVVDRKAALKASLLALEEAETAAPVLKRAIDPVQEERAHQRLLKQTAEVDETKLKGYDDSDIDDGGGSSESDLDADDSSSDTDEDDEDDEAALQAELAKIREEREETKRKADAELAAEEESKQEETALLGNPLLTGDGNGRMKRRWNDDVVFRNQAKGEPAIKKRFINDTVRNDFHKRFLNKFIR
jgi:protein CWC15